MHDFYIYDFVNAFGLIQGICLYLVILFYPGGNKESNKWIALHILCLSLALSAPFSQKLFSGIVPRADRFTEPILLLIYPFLYLYIVSLSRKLGSRFIFLHMLPFLFFIPLVAISLYHQQDLTSWSLDNFGFNIILAFFVAAKVVLYCIYLYWCWRALRSSQQLIQQNFSETSRINLDWLAQLLLIGMGLLLLYILVMIVIIIHPSWARLNFLLVAAVTLYIYFASYKALSQPSIFLKKSKAREPLRDSDAISELLPEKNSNEPQSERIKYERSALPEERLADLKSKLESLMRKDRLFLEPELTIQALGEKLNSSPYYISQVLSQKMKKNFYDFVNYYRVEEAKTLLEKPSMSNFTILSIAFESGFNSKTTFNSVFKKFTGQTPSQYKSGLKS